MYKESIFFYKTSTKITNFMKIIYSGYCNLSLLQYRHQRFVKCFFIIIVNTTPLQKLLYCSVTPMPPRWRRTATVIQNYKLWELKAEDLQAHLPHLPGDRTNKETLGCDVPQGPESYKSFIESSFGPEDMITPTLPQDISSFIQKAATLKLFGLRILLCFKITKDSTEILLT